MKMNNKSTIWFDFISYIFIPFYILTLSIEIVRSISNNNLIFDILLIIILLFSIFVFLNTIRRNKRAYYTLYIFYIISMITIVLYFMHKYNITKISYKIELLIVSLLLWCIPNIIYLYKRKYLFNKHNVAHIKKCPGCNRIIPINMKSCGKCNYKED